jgi:hypothetical protein
MDIGMKLNKCFMTGCDSVTEWQLPWFIDNYNKHCNVPLVICNFGMTEHMLDSISPFTVIDCTDVQSRSTGWFGKPLAMSRTPAAKTCWLDTDCQVMQDPEGLFDYIRPNKLLMAVDRPWSDNPSRNQWGKWHNSGVVAFEGRPSLLTEWYHQCKIANQRGDQETLYWMMGGDELRRITFIEDLPAKYNVLRLDIGKPYCPAKPVIMHWTGQKGNDVIRKQLRNM